MKYPKGEIVWVHCYDSNHCLQYIITSKPVRDCYYLYKLENEGFVKIAKGSNPTSVERKYFNRIDKVN